MAGTIFGGGPVEIDSPETMFAILRELVGDDAAHWRGMVDVWQMDGAPMWRLEVNSDKGSDGEGNRVTAFIGDYLVMAYGRLLKLSPDEV